MSEQKPYYVIAYLVNFATDRFHPILFRLSPTPSGIQRYKSKGHHTIGFDTFEEAEKHVLEEMVPKLGGARVVSNVYDWDGEGVPAMIEYF